MQQAMLVIDYNVRHLDSIVLTIAFTSSTFDIGILKAIVVVGSPYFDLAPEPFLEPPFFNLVIYFNIDFIADITNSLLSS